jgi:hypothetical protein
MLRTMRAFGRRIRSALLGGALLLGPVIWSVLGTAACPAAECGGCCPPWYVHCQEAPPRIKFKCACPRPVCVPCDEQYWGYFPTCWRRWPAPYANCPERNPPWVALAPPCAPPGCPPQPGLMPPANGPAGMPMPPADEPQPGGMGALPGGMGPAPRPLRTATLPPGPLPVQTMVQPLRGIPVLGTAASAAEPRRPEEASSLGMITAPLEAPAWRGAGLNPGMEGTGQPPAAISIPGSRTP